MDGCEIRMRCIEAAARNPDLRHAGGVVQAVLEQAQKYAEFVQGKPLLQDNGGTLKLPKKGA